MTDYFVLLNEPRRPWLDPDELKQKFLAVSTAVHPDRVHGLGESERAEAHTRYVELNAAYKALREPKERLRHLLTLEFGAAPKDIQRIPPELMETFMTVGQLCKRADGVIQEKAGVTSPLLKVQWFERSQQETEPLQTLLKQLNDKRETLITSLKQIDAEWNVSDSAAANRSEQLSRLEELLRLFSYYDRWIGQVQERIARLSF